MAYPAYTGTTIDPNSGQPIGSGGPVTQPGQFDWIAQLLGGAGNLATSGLDMRDAGRAAGMADPFSGERQAYQTQLRDYMGANSINPAAATQRSSSAYDMLQGLLQNPGSLVNMPGYQFGLNQALEGVNRGAGASGMLNSGNRLAALQDRGEGYARGWQNQIFNQLLGNVGAAGNVDALGLNAQQQGYNQLQHLGGADTGSPTAAAQALLTGRSNQDTRIGQGIGGLATGAAGLLNSPAWAAIVKAIGGGGGGGGSGYLPDPSDVLGQGGGGYLPDPSDILGGSDFSDLFSGASGFDIYG